MLLPLGDVLNIGPGLTTESDCGLRSELDTSSTITSDAYSPMGPMPSPPGEVTPSPAVEVDAKDGAIEFFRRCSRAATPPEYRLEETLPSRLCILERLHTPRSAKLVTTGLDSVLLCAIVPRLNSPARLGRCPPNGDTRPATPTTDRRSSISSFRARTSSLESASV